MSEYAELLNPLSEYLREASNLALSNQPTCQFELKPDGSIVTNVDRAVEETLRQSLPKLVPNSGFFGEEFGLTNADSPLRWFVDPIDGTSNYNFGSPLWGISIALASQDQLLIGGIALPAFGDILVASYDSAVLHNGNPVGPMPAGPILDHELIGICEHTLKRLTNPPPGKSRCNGAFVVDGVFTTLGRFRGMVGSREKLYDVAATVLFGQLLGADIRYVNGQPFLISELWQGESIQSPWFIFPKQSGWLPSEIDR